MGDGNKKHKLPWSVLRTVRGDELFQGQLVLPGNPRALEQWSGGRV